MTDANTLKRSVIIDTDPGIDDAIAIMFAFGHPGLNVIGVTTVGGNIGLDVTTRNALRILALLGKDCPVYSGAASPLARTSKNEERIHGTDGLGGINIPEPVTTPAGTDAVAFLAQSLLTAPEGTIDILALGPLTNIALLVQREPEAAKRIGKLIAMGGAIHEPGNMGPKSEFNIAYDPEAAEIVLAAGLPLTLIPLDVTRKVRADRAYIERLIMRGTPSAIASRDLIIAYFGNTSGGESRPLHDPCVPVFAVRPELFHSQEISLAVDCSQTINAGTLQSGPHPVQVAMGVNAPATLDYLLEHLH